MNSLKFIYLVIYSALLFKYLVHAGPFFSVVNIAMNKRDQNPAPGELVCWQKVRIPFQEPGYLSWPADMEDLQHSKAQEGCVPGGCPGGQMERAYVES